MTSPEKLRRLERMEWALKETERLNPVAYILMRKASAELELGGFRIAQPVKGTQTKWPQSPCRVRYRRRARLERQPGSAATTSPATSGCPFHAGAAGPDQGPA